MQRIQDEIANFKSKRIELLRKDFGIELMGSSGFIIRTSENRSDDRIDLMICALVHGDEVVGLEAINLILSRIVSGEQKISIDIGFLLCNVDAALKGVRFIETDLNRSFMVNEIVSVEQKRAAEIAQLVARANFVIDLHQTVEPTESPFFVFEHDPQLIQLAQFLSPSLPVVTFASLGFSRSGKTLTEFASTKNIPALAVEWGQKGFSNEMAQAATDFIFTIANKIGLSQGMRSKNTADLKVFYLAGHIENSNGAQLNPGLINGSKVEKNQQIGTSHSGPVVSPFAGKIFFPKYGELAKVSPELCEIGVEVTLTALAQF